MEAQMDFSRDTKVKDIAVASCAATRILEEAGVDYCCGGDRSLQNACSDAGASSEEILKRLRAAGAQAGPGDVDWISASLCQLTQHIQEKHHRYVRRAIQSVQNLLSKVRAKHGTKHTELAEIEQIFLALSQEMTMHMQKEEHILFPYIDALERSASGNGKLEPPFFQTVRNPIQAMMSEHDSAGDLAKQIRKASSDYTPPADACASFQSLYRELREFEADLHQHVHLENNILFPRAIALEEKASRER
jgi:regulator of cell morphogenesis and NO signaling